MVLQAPAPGKRLPSNYRLVLDVVERSGRGIHQTVAEIHAAARAEQPALGFSTVYRALIRLRDAKLVSEILIPGAPAAVYERAAPEHAHFFCVACKGVSDLDYHMPAATVERLARGQHADVQAVSLALHGMCERCRRAAE
jgi:Fe2+ or Zn2+ uptake regulation protein